ncbi:MAG: hypothetical protein JNM95_00335 [Chitinophagaceae bacterium]|nr:hypothetical protein [Chitinophagaceae bacterium]
MNKELQQKNLNIRMKTNKQLLLVVLLLVIGTLTSWAQLAGDFRSAATGSWNSATTWERYNGSAWQASGVGLNNPGQIPTATSSVFIQSGHTVSLNANAFCSILTINAGATLDASNMVLEVDSDWVNNGSFIASTSTVNFNGSDQFITGSSATTFYHLDINSALSTTLENHINVLGNLSSNVGTIKTETFNVNIVGLTSITGTGSIKDAGAGTKSYQGGFYINGGSFVSTIPISIPSTGILNVVLGNLTINAGTGTFFVAAGVPTNFAGGNITVAAGQTLSLNNTVNMSAGVVNGNGSVVFNADLNMTGGTFNGAGSTTINSPYALQISTGISTISRSLTTPTLQWTGGDFTIGSGSVVSVNTANISASGTVSGNGTLAISGIGSSFNKSSSTTSTLNCVVNISTPATTFITGGTLVFGGGGSISSPISLSNTTTLQFNLGSYILNSPTSITGGNCSLLVSGANVTANIPLGLSSSSTIAVSSGVLSLASASTVQAPITVSGGTLNLSSSTTFTNTITITNGTVTTTAPVTLASTSSFTMQNGSLNINAGSGNFSILSGASTTISGGTITIASAQNFNLASSGVMSAGTISGLGSLNLSGAFLMSGGSMTGAGSTVLSTPGEMTIDGNVSFTRPTNVNSTFNWLSGTITLTSGSVITISNGVTATFSSNGILSGGGTTGLVVSGNGTTLVKTGTATTTINAAFTLAASTALQVNDGTLTLGGGGSLSGAMTIVSTKTLQFTNGVFNINAPATLSGVASTIVVNGATVNCTIAIGVNSTSSLIISSGSLVLNAASSLAPSVTLTGGTLAIAAPTTLTNVLLNNGGTITTTAAITLSSTSGFTMQAGSMNINSGTSSFSIPAEVVSTVSGGTISIASGQSLNIAGITNMNGGTINGVGTYIQSAALNMSGGSFSGNGSSTISNTLTITGNVTLNRASTIQQLNWLSGNISLGGNVTVTGVMSTSSNGTISGSSNLVVNSLIKSNTNTTTINSQLNTGSGGMVISEGLLVLGSNDPVTGNLSITSGAKLRITNGEIITVQTLSLGGLGAIAGSWGSNTTSATNKNDTYFDLGTTGIVQVSTNSCITPIATINASSLLLSCVTNAISLTAGGSGFYLWENGSTNAVRTISTPGTYVLTLSSNGCGTSSTNVTITQDITSPSVAGIGSTSTKTCTNNVNGVIIGETPQVGFTYSWSPAIGLSNASIANPVANPTITTAYTLTKTKSTSGCSSTAVVTILVDTAVPTGVDISSSTSVITCTTPSIVLNVSATDNSNTSNLVYSWTDNIQGATRSVSVASTYTVVITDPDNGCSVSLQKTITADNTTPSVSISSSQNPICSGTSSVLTATGASNFEWTPTLSTSSTLTVTPAISTTYTVTGTNANGCFATTTLLLMVNPIPTVIASSNQTYCNGQAVSSVSLSGTPAGVLFDITGGAARGLPNQIGVSAIPNFTASSVGSSLVTITPKANGCIGTPSSYSLTVSNCPPVIVNLKLFLQGYYMGSGAMQPVLYNQGEIIDPNSTTTDNIIVELHAATPPYATVKTSLAVLKTNGQVTCSFPGSVTNTPFYLVVHHRNSLETWSANSMILSSAVYDFTTDASKAFGNNQIQLEPNVFGFYSGDVNQDQGIDVFDYIEIDPDIVSGNFGFLTTDLNGDGVVDSFDFLLIDPNIQNGISVTAP